MTESKISRAIDRAKEELEQIPLDEIHALGIRKSHGDLLGSHTVVTYPPLDALQEVDGDAVFSDASFQPQVGAYAHIPFCGYPCKFCPYTTLGIIGKDSAVMPNYFSALQREVESWAQKLAASRSEVTSLYVGGGTPFAIPLGQLEQFLLFMQATLPFADGASINVETSPKATMEADALEKLAMLRELGVDRMSVGVQSFDFATLRDTARTYRGHDAHVERAAVERLMQSGIGHINVDMIQDLPLSGQRDVLARLQHDLSTVAELQPHHVTWYNMRLRPETTYARHQAAAVNELDSLLTRLAIWNFMQETGYEILEGDRFARADGFEDQFRKTRGSVDVDLLGMGVSAYSHVTKGFFVNPRVIGDKVRADSRVATKEYIDAIAKQGHAIASGFPMTADEYLAGKFALGLKRGVNLDRINEFRLVAPAEFMVYNNLVVGPATRFADAGLLEVVDGEVRFTRRGRLFENEICAAFYTPRVIHAAHRRRGTLTPEIKQAYTEYVGAIAANKAFYGQKSA